MQWLADHIGAEHIDDEALERQVRVAPVLFVDMDDPTALPETRQLLREAAVDVDAMLAWYQPGARLRPWQTRLGIVDDALTALQPWVTETLDAMSGEDRVAYEAVRERFMRSMDSEGARRRR